MGVYRFKVSFEDWDEVVREIEVKSTQTFGEFQKEIQRSIGFDAEKPCSFYISDDYWRKGQELASDPESRKGSKPMSKARLCDFMVDPHQKIYYVYDYTSMWTFYIELSKIIVTGDASASYPRCVKSHGEAPKQFGPTTITSSTAFAFEEELGLDGEDEPEGEESEEEVGEIAVDGDSEEAPEAGMEGAEEESI